MFARRLISSSNVCAKFSTSAVLRSKSVQCEPVFVHNGPGMRNYEFRRNLEGNGLNEGNLSFLKDKFNLISTNPAVIVVGVTSEDPLVFSKGFEKTESKESTAKLIKLANQLNLTFTQLKHKETVSFLSGDMSGSAFGVFSGAKYRLGTDVTNLTLNVFESDHSMFGGIAHSMVRAVKGGVAMTRCLAILNKPMDSDYMLDLGLLTHITNQEAQHDLQHALGHSWAENDNVKGMQNDQVDRASVGVFIDLMSSNDEGAELHESKSFDTFNTDPVWDQILLVNPHVLHAEERKREEMAEVKALAAKKVFISEVEHCFNVEKLEETTRRLKVLSASGTQWAKEAEEIMETIGKTKLEAWFHLTRFASKESLETTLGEEERLFGLIA